MAKKTAPSLASLQQEIEALKADIKRLNAKLALSNSDFLNIVSKSLHGVVILDQKKMVVYSNYVAIRLLDRNLADLLGEPLLPEIDLQHLVNSHETMTEIQLPRADGSETFAEVFVHRIEWNNEPCYMLNFRDITERRKAEEILEYRSTHDYLTELPNRVFFEIQLNKAIQHAKETEQYMALVYLDLDNFKLINDTLGHGAGDLLLKKIAGVLRQVLRSEDSVARLGGDEFAIILNGLKTPEYAGIVCRLILDRLADHFFLEGQKVYSSASIGISVYPNDGLSPADLIKNADKAMYDAKSKGKNQYQVFSQKLGLDSERNLQIINGISSTELHNELRLYYQPIIDVNLLTCCGIEALVRWQHPQLGLLLPDEFLPSFEQAGHMLNLGQWVLQQALSDYIGLKMDNLYLAINMSANELADAETVNNILSSIELSGISMHNFVVELTERSIMQDWQTVIKESTHMSQTGMKIAIDDYGTGYSSLSVLKQLPITLLKIDKSFISDIDVNICGATIVQSSIRLAHSLGIKVIAEGVETKEQFDFLKEHQCDYVQGFYFSPPVELHQLLAVIGEKKDAPSSVII